jgi:hypothetical protein
MEEKYMKVSIKVIIALAVILDLAFCMAISGNETTNATVSLNKTNATAQVAALQNCSDLRNCIENCSKIQNCSAYMNCIDNCTLNATAPFGEDKGVVVVKRFVWSINNTTNTTDPTNETKMAIPITLPNKR